MQTEIVKCRLFYEVKQVDQLLFVLRFAYNKLKDAVNLLYVFNKSSTELLPITITR